MKKFRVEIYSVELARQITVKTVTAADAKQAVESIGLCLPTHWHASLIYLNNDRSQAQGFVSDLNNFKFVVHITILETGNGT